jgi:kelch-like protein 6
MVAEQMNNKALSCRRRRCSVESIQNNVIRGGGGTGGRTRGGFQGQGDGHPTPPLFVDRTRDENVLKGFSELYDNRQLLDVTLTVDGKDFAVHRALMAASSDYFRAMFTNNVSEKTQQTVNINGVDSVSMGLVVSFLYTGQVELQTDTVQNLLSTANLFQLLELKKGCADFMANKLDVDNCIGIHFFAQAHECESLEFHAWDVITENFEAVSSTTEFLELTWENVIDIIKYDDIQATEEEVFEAALKWLQLQPEKRNEHIYAVFSNIRFSLIDKHYFFDKVKSNPFLQVSFDYFLLLSPARL